MNVPAVLFPGLALLLGVPRFAAAQAPPTPPPAREGQIEVAVVATSGNAETQSIGLAGELIVRPPSWVVTVKSDFVRNKSDGVVNAKSLRAMERAARALKPGVEAFGQHAYLRDRFSGVEHRNSVDAGLSYRLFESPRQELFGDAGFGYLNEQRSAGLDLSTALATAGARYRLHISETSEFTDELLFAADVAEAGTWRISQAAAITASVTTLVALKISSGVRFVNVPVPGFERVDTVTSASLLVSF